jgi:hypothetical protein
VHLDHVRAERCGGEPGVDRRRVIGEPDRTTEPRSQLGGGTKIFASRSLAETSALITGSRRDTDSWKPS